MLNAVGAASDPRLAELVAGFRRSSRDYSETITGLVLGPQRVPADSHRLLADAIWALTSSFVYRRLVIEGGWTPEAYEEWLCSVIGAHVAGAVSLPQRAPMD